MFLSTAISRSFQFYLIFIFLDLCILAIKKKIQIIRWFDLISSNHFLHYSCSRKWPFNVTVIFFYLIAWKLMFTISSSSLSIELTTTNGHQHHGHYHYSFFIVDDIILFFKSFFTFQFKKMGVDWIDKFLFFFFFRLSSPFTYTI